MRVAIDAVGIRMGGAATLLNELLIWLPAVRPEWDWLVYLLPRRYREFDDPAGRKGITIDTVSLGNSGVGRLVWSYRELPRRLETGGADLLLAFANVASPPCPVSQVAYIHQTLAFGNESTALLWSFREARLRILRRLILRGAVKSKAVIVQTRDMRSRLEAAECSLQGRLWVVPGCVPSESRCAQLREDKRNLIDGAGWPKLAYVAHPAEHKNHAAIIRALAAIVTRFPKAILFLTLQAGGPRGTLEGSYVSKLGQLADNVGVGDHIVWLGVLAQPEVRYLLRRSTVAVFPSLQESFGLPLAEAITEGCPLAASDLPFARDVAGSAAVYFDPLDPDSIAQCVTSLIENPEKMARLREEAAARKALFHPQKVAEEIATILETAVNKDNRTRAQLDSAPC